MSPVNNVVVSFVIPALNEGEYIGSTLNSIHQNAPKFHYQIIVVDNGSNDNTLEIVENNNAIFFRHLGITIAALRNKGVEVSEGEILVFLDADVIVTPQWKKEFDAIAADLLREPEVVTGSRCHVHDEENWISRYWFSPMAIEKANYINSGHLITSVKLFKSIKGFREELITAEDYDLCARAKKHGAKIINNPKLLVIHMGYPLTIKCFIARERWHGLEDFRSFNNVLQSKVALVAIFNILLFICSLFVSIMNNNIMFIVPYFIIMYLVSAISSLLKFRYLNFRLFFYSSLIFYFYFTGRSLAFLDRLKINHPGS